MSDSPRTDALCGETDDGCKSYSYELPHLARTLERELAALQSRVGELERHERRLKAMMPLFEEARDALPAISETSRRLRNISSTLADRMDEVGDPVRWAALDRAIAESGGEK